MIIHARSFTLVSSTEVIFYHEILSWMTENGWIGSLRRKSRPHVTERSKIEVCGSKSVRDRDMVIFRFRIFIPLKPIHG